MHFFLLWIKSLLASESASPNLKKSGSRKLSVKDSVRDDSRLYILKKDRENVLPAKIVDNIFQKKKLNAAYHCLLWIACAFS